MKTYQSWGRIPHVSQKMIFPSWRDSFSIEGRGDDLLPYGRGRSYGDSCLNDQGTLCVTSGLNHFIHFDKEQGILRCESGVGLDDILQLIVPHGWFLAATPGTKYVTLGGAIANDVHGKNHHLTGTFGCHVTQFELLRTSGERLLCSERENVSLFKATIAGLGLTGLITWAEIRLKKITSELMDTETIRFDNLAGFFSLSEESDKEWEYTVSWIDCLAQGKHLGRGLFMRGRHSDHLFSNHKKSRSIKLGMPMNAPGFLLNQATIRLFNEVYYRKNRQSPLINRGHYEPFFYPLDSIENWNRMYGRRGFYQYQCVVPLIDGQGIINTLLETIAASGMGSFLSVLKKFGDVVSPGMMSFPRPGVTLALDFPNYGDKVLALFEQLDKIVMQAGGAVYPAKDARMSSEAFQHYFPQWTDFNQYRDPGISSSFWRRITGE
ncbi:Putative oxidoreductase [hydrothermal vent metagenome]|uniref:Oxidoreductase n=1 Tax=hydrothermal vent metagenome TaxID=652676 RepID=A0A3B1BJP1_9ZZZZ